MKNTKKILLGYLFAMMFVLGVTMVGCGSDDDCPDGQTKDTNDKCCTDANKTGGVCNA